MRSVEPPWERLALMDPWVHPFSEVDQKGFKTTAWQKNILKSLYPGKETYCIFCCGELIDEGIQQGTGSHHSGALTTICLGLLDNKKMNEGSLDGLWSMQILRYMSATLYIAKGSSFCAVFLYISDFEGILLLDLFLEVSRDFTNPYISKPSEQKQNWTKTTNTLSRRSVCVIYVCENSGLSYLSFSPLRMSWVFCAQSLASPTLLCLCTSLITHGDYSNLFPHSYTLVHTHIHTQTKPKEAD